MAEFFLKPDEKFVMIGDSITDCGRRGDYAPYGRGYVTMVRDQILARYPGYNTEIVNKGISGNTIRDLKGRWQEDVIAEKPDVLSIKIGINDVWRFVANRKEDAVPLDEYEKTYRELLDETLEKTGARLILIDPYYLDTNKGELFRSMIDEYCECVHKIAEDYKAVSVRTMDAFDEVLAKQPPEFWADDKVHPFSFGHMVIARAVLKAMNYEF